MRVPHFNLNRIPNLIQSPLPYKEAYILSKVVPIKNFYESGTYKGGSAILASKIFENVHTVELSEKLYNENLKLLNQFKIKTYLGKSEVLMEDIIKNIDGNILYWLDGHIFFGVRGDENTPILKELNIIHKTRKDENDVIIIDDARLFTGKQEDKNDIESGYPTIETLYKTVLDLWNKEKCLAIKQDAFYILNPKYVKNISAYILNINDTYKTLNDKKMFETRRH